MDFVSIGIILLATGVFLQVDCCCQTQSYSQSTPVPKYLYSLTVRFTKPQTNYFLQFKCGCTSFQEAGWCNMRGFKVLLLTNAGGKSGKSRTLPLGLFDWPGGYLVVASNSGQPFPSVGYHNLMSHPQATVQVLDQLYPSCRSSDWRDPCTRLAAGDYQRARLCAVRKKTTRIIPPVLLRPSK